MVWILPGIRPAGATVHDQKRVATTQEAISAGTDFIVVGRPIIAAENPAEVAEKIIGQIGQIGLIENSLSG